MADSSLPLHYWVRRIPAGVYFVTPNYMKSSNNACERCGKVQNGHLTFAVGASAKPDWCVCQGTGRFVCPDCYPAEQTDCRTIIDNLLTNNSHE